MYAFKTEAARTSWARILKLVDEEGRPANLSQEETRALLLMSLSLIRESKTKKGGRALQMLCEIFDDALSVAASDQEGTMVNEDEGMEKYGVAVEPEQTPVQGEKRAEAENCRKCGSKLERHGQVLKCPKCGTLPYEAKKEG